MLRGFHKLSLMVCNVDLWERAAKGLLGWIRSTLILVRVDLFFGVSSSRMPISCMNPTFLELFGLAADLAGQPIAQPKTVVVADIPDELDPFIELKPTGRSSNVSDESDDDPFTSDILPSTAFGNPFLIEDEHQAFLVCSTLQCIGSKSRFLT